MFCLKKFKSPPRFCLECYRNDIQDAIQHSTLRYYCKVKCVHGCTLLQLDINANRFMVCRYELHLNPLKMQVLTLTCKTLAVLSHYCLDKSLIKHVPVVRDLGVILDEELNFNSHVVSILAVGHSHWPEFCVSRSFVFMSCLEALFNQN